jgi:hypothetical protein
MSTRTTLAVSCVGLTIAVIVKHVGAGSMALRAFGLSSIYIRISVITVSPTRAVCIELPVDVGVESDLAIIRELVAGLTGRMARIAYVNRASPTTTSVRAVTPQAVIASTCEGSM